MSYWNRSCYDPCYDPCYTPCYNPCYNPCPVPTPVNPSIPRTIQLNSTGLNPSLVVISDGGSGFIPTYASNAVGLGATVSVANAINANASLTLPGSGFGIYPYQITSPGTIVSFTPTYTVTTASASVAVPGTSVLTFNAVLYRAVAGSNTFTPIANVTFITYSGTVTIALNTVYTGTSTGLNIPVNTGDRLVIGFGFNNAGTPGLLSVLATIGNGSAVINIV